MSAGPGWFQSTMPTWQFAGCCRRASRMAVSLDSARLAARRTIAGSLRTCDQLEERDERASVVIEATLGVSQGRSIAASPGVFIGHPCLFGIADCRFQISDCGAISDQSAI